jgi:hypothetical protein
MSVIVAALFDSQADADVAMEKLLNAGIEDLETQLVQGDQRTRGDAPAVGGPVFPVVPNTDGGFGHASGAATGMPFLGGRSSWLDDVDEEERAFYHEGLKEGGTVVLARVDDDSADHVRRMMNLQGARTYVKD